MSEPTHDPIVLALAAMVREAVANDRARRRRLRVVRSDTHRGSVRGERLDDAKEPRHG